MFGRRKKDNQAYPKIPPKKNVSNVVGSAKAETGRTRFGFLKRKEKQENVCPICKGHSVLPYGHKCLHCNGKGICHCKTHPPAGDLSPHQDDKKDGEKTVKALTLEEVKAKQHQKHEFLAQKKKEVDASNVVNYIMEYEGGDISLDDYLKLFSYLIKSGQAWQLQGSLYGRPARELINKEIISPNGKIMKTVEQIRTESQFEQD